MLILLSRYAYSQTCVNFNINPQNSRKPISSLIYGTNDLSTSREGDPSRIEALLAQLLRLHAPAPPREYLSRVLVKEQGRMYFVNLNDSHIVNLACVQEVETHFNGDYIVHLKLGQTLKWTRNYRDKIQAFLGKRPFRVIKTGRCRAVS